VTTGLRTEIAEDFMTSLQSVFKEHYIEVPEGKENLVDELSDQVSELEESLNKSTEDNIRLHEAVQSFERAEVIRSQSLGLAETEAEKLNSLVEGLEFDNKESFEMKVKTVKESYFSKGKVEAADEVNSLAGEDEAPANVSDAMAMYTQAISKFNK
jgi:gas vesicle protein